MTSGRRWGLLLVLLVVIQLVVLYGPSTGAGPQLPHLDKVVHALVFAAPTAVALLWRRGWWVVGALALHATVSELAQARLLSSRSGDVWDMVADLTGILLGVGLVVAFRVRRRW